MVTFLLNIGLNNIIILRLFLFFPRAFLDLFFRVDLKPLFLRAPFYSNLVDSDIVSVEELLHNLSLMDRTWNLPDDLSRKV